MAAIDETIDVLFLDPATRKTTPGRLHIRRWDAKESSSKALKLAGLCWAGAFVAIFIPLVHFILVPFLILAGLVAFYVMGQQQGQIMGGEGPCPACGAPFKVAAGLLKLPQSDLCATCLRPVRIELPASTPVSAPVTASAPVNSA